MNAADIPTLSSHEKKKEGGFMLFWTVAAGQYSS
jgi:hypothetical protein